MSRIRYLIDEDTPHAIGDGLLRLRPEAEVLMIGHDPAPPLRTPDPQILSWLERSGYALITRNRRTMPVHLYNHLQAGGHIPGIFLLRPNASIGRIIDDLLLIWEAATLEEYQDQIEYIPF